MSVTFHPVMPEWLVAVVGVSLVGLLALGTVKLLHKKAPGRWVAFFAVMRLVAIAVFLVCLLRPIVTYEKAVERREDLLVLYDTSASMSALTDNETRLARSLKAMNDAGLNQSLSERYAVHDFAFDRTARPIDASGVASLQPEGTATDLAESLRAAWISHPDARTRNVLLVTDGVGTNAAELSDTALRLGAQLHTLKLPEEPLSSVVPAVSIANVQSPQRVLLGAECRFRVTLERTGDLAEPLTLELTEDGQRIVEHRLTFEPGQSQLKVNLSHQPTSAGTKRYAVRLAAADAATPPAEPYELTVDVESQATNVLLLEDTWRWEFKFLRRVLDGDPSFSFTALLSRGPGTYMQLAEPDRTAPLAGFPQASADLERFGIIVLGDVRPQRWPMELAPAIHRAVVEQGKSLIVIAGPGLAQLAQAPQLEALLPVVLSPDAGRPVLGPIAVGMSAEGAASPLFHTSMQSGETSLWANLPALDQIYAPLRKRPGATILLEAPEQVNEFGPMIVMAEQAVGRGRVLYIGTDTLWRWETLGPADEAGNTPHSLFWQQTLRALAPLRSIDGGVTLWLDTNRGRYAAGDTVQLTATLHSDAPPLVAPTETPPTKRATRLTACSGSRRCERSPRSAPSTAA